MSVRVRVVGYGVLGLGSLVYGVFGLVLVVYGC